MPLPINLKSKKKRYTTECIDVFENKLLVYLIMFFSVNFGGGYY